MSVLKHLTDTEQNMLRMRWISRKSNKAVAKRYGGTEATIQALVDDNKANKKAIIDALRGEEPKKVADKAPVIKSEPVVDESEANVLEVPEEDPDMLIESLNDRDQEIARLTFKGKMSAKEISTSTGYTVSTIRHAIRKARALGYEDAIVSGESFTDEVKEPKQETKSEKKVSKSSKKKSTKKKTKAKTPKKPVKEQEPVQEELDVDPDKDAIHQELLESEQDVNPDDEPIEHLLTTDSVILIVDGETRTFDKSHFNYAVVRELVEQKKWAEVRKYSDAKETFKKMTYGFFNVSEQGQVTYRNATVGQDIADKILDFHQRGIKPVALMKFYDNLAENPSEVSIESAFRFVVHNNLPIDKDGHLIAYKKVRDDYTDVHTGKFDNSPGQMVAMPREEVDHNPNKTCSSGLHACSAGYLGHFGGQKIVAVRINPRDICSVPHDYNNSKMRTMRYEVLCDLDGKHLPENYVDQEVCDWWKH